MWRVFERGSLNTGQISYIMLTNEFFENSVTFKCDIKGAINSYNKSQRDALFLKFILIKNSICFGQTYCPSAGVSTVHTQH